MTELEKVIDGIDRCIFPIGGARCKDCPYFNVCCEEDMEDVPRTMLLDAISQLKAQEPDKSKYEYHIDHTDCPWYISGVESKCPVTCSQYRDGWNDAMDYIYKGGNGYRPYKRR